MSTENTSSSTTAPTHTTETMTDRKKSRELAEARASGAMAPEVDVKTGTIINPHNPEFITKRPWYLGGDEGPSLDHQADQRTDSEKLELDLVSADRLVQEERQKSVKARMENKLSVGMWVEAKKRNRKPYLICKIVKISKKGTVFDLKYDDDGFIEKNVKMKKSERGLKNARIRPTKTGTRSFAIDHDQFGKETFDSKRDAYHGFEAQSDSHMKKMQDKFHGRDAIRRKIRTKQATEKQSQTQTGKGTKTKDNKSKTSSGNDPNNSPADSDSDSDYDSDDGSDSDDEFVQRDEDAKMYVSRLARQGGVGGQQMKVTARNLRIREDTAKYLRNLDPNSAYYDPKSRSMRDNPNPVVGGGQAGEDEPDFAGDNFSRISGDAIKLAQTQVFAWDVANTVGNGGVVGDRGGGNAGAVVAAAASTAGGVIHPQANPSQAEMLQKKFTTQASDLKARKKKAVLDKYGGAEHLDGTGGLGSVKILDLAGGNAEKSTVEAERQRQVRFGESVTEEVYTRDGRLASNAPGGGGVGKTATKNAMLNQKSKYEEDTFINGHHTVWGSYFHKGAFRWGYADDHSLLRNSYCTGDNGRIANDEANEMKYGTGKAGSAQLAQAREMLKAIPMAERSSNNEGGTRHSSSKMYGEMEQFNDNLDTEKVKAALEKQKHAEKMVGKNGNNTCQDDRKRRYNSMSADDEVTQEEMEAYRLQKERADDPMAKLSRSGEILDYVK